jgi:hypothetical protein
VTSILNPGGAETRPQRRREPRDNSTKFCIVGTVGLVEQVKLDPGGDGLVDVADLQGKQLDAQAATLSHLAHVAAASISMTVDTLSFFLEATHLCCANSDQCGHFLGGLDAKRRAYLRK